MSPVVTNFVQVDSTTHKLMFPRQILEMLQGNAINIKKALVLGD